LISGGFSARLEFFAEESGQKKGENEKINREKTVIKGTLTPSSLHGCNG